MIIKRDIYPLIKKHLDSEEVSLITGPRQCGKTTVIKALIEELVVEGKKSVYLNLDIEDDFSYVKSQKTLLNYVKLKLGKIGYVFIDEIQRKEDAGIFIKGLYDMKTGYKFVISGSGSVELKEKVSEGLSGRKKTFNMSTLTFREFVNYKTNYEFSNNLVEYFNSEIFDNYLLEEYLRFGGYPKLVLKDTESEKKDVLQSIYESFIDKDLKDLLDIKNPAAVDSILTLLSIRIGKSANMSKLASKVDISFSTLKTYLFYLNKTYILNYVRPYFENPETEVTKMPVFYFNDLGMRNYVFNRLSHYDADISGSMLFQNFVFLALKNNSLVLKTNYWRTKDGAEVDFIARVGSENIPIEVKFSSLKKDSISRSLASYIKRYNPKTVYIVNLSKTLEKYIGDTKIKFIPYKSLFIEAGLR